MPLSGLRLKGSSVAPRKSRHIASLPSPERTMSAGAAASRSGRATAITWPMFPSWSAYSMFWPGTAKVEKAARNSAKSRARATLSMAVVSSLAMWPVQRSAKGRAAASASCGASDTTGPQAVARISTSRSNHQRTLMRSRRAVTSWPSIS